MLGIRVTLDGSTTTEAEVLKAFFSLNTYPSLVCMYRYPRDFLLYPGMQQWIHALAP